MRLDVWLAEHGIYKSRTRAAGAVKSGCVSLDGKTIVRPSYELDETDASRLVCLPDPLERRARIVICVSLHSFSFCLFHPFR